MRKILTPPVTAESFSAVLISSAVGMDGDADPCINGFQH